jgi:hypothetical protein
MAVKRSKQEKKTSEEPNICSIISGLLTVWY